MLEKLQHFFDKSVESAMKHYKITVGIGVLSIVVGVFFFSNLSQELFPVIERNQFAVEVYLSKNSSLEETEKVVKAFEKVKMSVFKTIPVL